MGVSIEQYRASIGHFYLKCCSGYTSLDYYWSYLYLALYVSLYIKHRLIKLSNDIGENPGPALTSNNKPIKICQVNMRSIVAELDSNYKQLNERPPKVIELDAFCHDNDVSILGISETWCNDTHTDKLVGLETLPKIWRRDRTDRAGGGLALYATNDTNVKRLPDIEPTDSEIMCFEYQLPNKLNKFAFLCLCYRPKERDIIDFCADILDIMDYISDKGYYNTMFIGDFNCKLRDWCPTDISNVQGEILKAFLDQNGYEQLVNFPTRFDIPNNRSSCLDYIITNGSTFVQQIDSFGPIANCDHIPIICSITCKTPKLLCYKRHVWNFKKGDFEKLNRLLNEFPWDQIFITDDINDIVDTWTDTFIELAKECIPYTEILVRPSDLPYMTSALRSLIRRKDRMFKLWAKTLRPDHREYYENLRNESCSALRKAERGYISEQCEKLKIDKNTSNWWDCIKKLCCFKKTTSTIAPIVNSDGLLVYDAESKAEIFNEFYASVSTINNDSDNIPANSIPIGPLLSNITILQDDVYKLLKKLDTSKATGPDNIGNTFLKNCASSISGVLTRIFNLSLTLGEFPNSWKIAHITPLHKKGSVHDFKMYRPVALLPCVSKVFEKLIFKEVYSHMKENGLISEFQSGFTPGDSTINQLIHISDRILKKSQTSQKSSLLFQLWDKVFKCTSY